MRYTFNEKNVLSVTDICLAIPYFYLYYLVFIFILTI
jgi:hypothetical protein